MTHTGSNPVLTTKTKDMLTINEIMDVLERGLKDDGKSFYSDEEKAERLYSLFNEESKKVFDRGYSVGYDRGARDAQTPSGWKC